MLRFSLIFALALSTSLTVICLLFTPQIVSVFLTDLAAMAYGVSFARILLCTSFLFGALFQENGLMWAQLVADVLSLLLAAALYRRKAIRMLQA